MRNKKKIFDKNDALLCIPEKNVLVKEILLDSGDLILSYPTMYKPLFMKIQKVLRKKYKKTFIRKIQLDQLGIDVWSLLDGNRNVKEIIKKFSKLHKLNHKEAEISVTLFLKSLGEKGLIGMREPLV
jgi:Coenzyme PQQ synthesis protein D (PqqD)